MVKVFICLSHLDKYELSQFSSALNGTLVQVLNSKVNLKKPSRSFANLFVLLLNQNQPAW